MIGGFYMAFSDKFFNKVEKKTNVDKDTILQLAKKLQDNDLKNEGTLREVIQTLSKMTGRDVSKEQEEKIISAVVNDKVPKDIEKMI
jgi:tetrahydromethanopterin S-methyltransferase subunit G